jgi:hypothetical protein
LVFASAIAVETVTYSANGIRGVLRISIKQINKVISIDTGLGIHYVDFVVSLTVVPSPQLPM